MNDDDLILTSIDDVVLDLGDVGAAQETLTLGSSSIDTITITGMDYSTMNTITLPTTGYTISSGASGSNYTSTYNWSGISANPPTVNIDTNGIDVKAGGDIKVDGKSLKEFMGKMEQRLSILVPDPEKLEKFEALKKAYEHYKTMEALCFPEKEEKDK